MEKPSWARLSFWNWKNVEIMGTVNMMPVKPRVMPMMSKTKLFLYFRVVKIEK
jgi:hypothetical protein